MLKVLLQKEIMNSEQHVTIEKQ